MSIIYLQNGANRDRVEEFWRHILASISKEEFYGYIDTIRNGSKFQKYLKGREVKKLLKRLSDIWVYWRRNYINISQFLYRVSHKLFFPAGKNRFHSAGYIYSYSRVGRLQGKTTVTQGFSQTWVGVQNVYRIYFYPIFVKTLNWAYYNYPFEPDF